MKRSFFSVLPVIFLFYCSLIMGQDSQQNVNWDAFSKNLVKAVKSGHPGLQQSAMQQIIRYKDNLDVKDAVYDIALIFRFKDDQKVRRLAMVTLYAINSNKALAYIADFLKYQDCECTKKQGISMITEYGIAKLKGKDVDIAALDQ